MRRRSPSTVACSGRRSPPTAASRSTPRATRSSSPSRPRRSAVAAALAGQRRARGRPDPRANGAAHGRTDRHGRGLRRDRCPSWRARRRRSPMAGRFVITEPTRRSSRTSAGARPRAASRSRTSTARPALPARRRGVPAAPNARRASTFRPRPPPSSAASASSSRRSRSGYDREPRVLYVVGPGRHRQDAIRDRARRLLAEEADGGTVFVPLAPLRDAALLLPAVAELLGATGAEPTAMAARSAYDARTSSSTTSSSSSRRRAAARRARLGRAGPTAARHEPRAAAYSGRDRVRPAADGRGRTVSRCSSTGHVRSGPTSRTPPASHELVRRLDGLPLAVELAGRACEAPRPRASSSSASVSGSTC